MILYGNSYGIKIKTHFIQSGFKCCNIHVHVIQVLFNINLCWLPCILRDQFDHCYHFNNITIISLYFQVF